MTNFVQVKVTDGKLLQLEKIAANNFKITGDFFCHPPEIIDQLEDILAAPLNINLKEEKLNTVFTTPTNDIIGFAASDLLNLYNQLT